MTDHSFLRRLIATDSIARLDEAGWPLFISRMMCALRFWDALLERYLGPARVALGEPAAARVWKDGRAVAFDDAVVKALDAAVR